MKIGKYKINSSALLTSILTVLAGIANYITDGSLVDLLVKELAYLTENPALFKHLLSEKVYQILVIVIPAVIGVLRVTNVRMKPPIEKVDKPEGKRH